MKRLMTAYLRDAGVVLGIRHRDSRGRFTKNNPYRFTTTSIAVCGHSRKFLARSPMAQRALMHLSLPGGSYLKAIKQ